MREEIEGLQDGCWKEEGKNKDLLPMAVGMGPDKELWERFRRVGVDLEERGDPVRELWERLRWVRLEQREREEL